MELKKIETEAVITISLTAQEANELCGFFEHTNLKTHSAIMLNHTLTSALYAIKNQPGRDAVNAHGVGQ